MLLVEYSDSSDGSDTPPSNQTNIRNQTPKAIKRKRSSTPQSALPPLPDNFHNLYASTARISKQDDPTLHGGRQRAKPHVEGNWPTHVYVEWLPSTENSNHLNHILTTLSDAPTPQECQVHSLLRSELGTELPLHISLSRPIVLLVHQRQPFVDYLTHAISKMNLSPFEVAVKGLDWVANCENTRWFLVLKLEKAPQNGLNKLLHLSNQTATEFGQPSLYTDSLPQPPVDSPQRRPVGNAGRWRESTRTTVSSSMSYSGPSKFADMSSSFHISIGWRLNAPTEAQKERLNTTGVDFQAMRVDINSVKAKVGNCITAISLASKVDNSNRIIET